MSTRTSERMIQVNRSLHINFTLCLQSALFLFVTNIFKYVVHSHHLVVVTHHNNDIVSIAHLDEVAFLAQVADIHFE